METLLAVHPERTFFFTFLDTALICMQMRFTSYLALVDYAPIWMDQLDLAMCVHVVGLRGRKQPEALAPS